MSFGGKIEVLLVEDSPDDLELTLRVLRKANLANQIQIARDGEEALQFLFCEGPYAGRNIEDSPRFVLLDLKLPKLGGLEVLARVKSDARTKATPVVVFSSSAEQRDVEESYTLGVNSYVVKPVNYDQFAAAIRDLWAYWLALNEPPQVA